MHPLLTLPQELQDIIFSYLDKQNTNSVYYGKNIYAICRSLNRDWHAYFTPLFWERLSTIKFDTLSALMTQPELRDALSKNAHHIKRLKTTRLDVLEFFVHSPPSLPPPLPPSSGPSPSPSFPLSTVTLPMNTNRDQAKLLTPPTYEFRCGTTGAPIQLTELSLRFDQFRSGPIMTSGAGSLTATKPVESSPTGGFGLACGFSAATGAGAVGIGTGFSTSSSGFSTSSSGSTSPSGFGTSSSGSGTTSSGFGTSFSGFGNTSPFGFGNTSPFDFGTSPCGFSTTSPSGFGANLSGSFGTSPAFDFGTSTTNTVAFDPTSFATTAERSGGFTFQAQLGAKYTPALHHTPLFNVHYDPASQRHLQVFKGCPLVPREGQLLIRLLNQNRTTLTVLHLEDLIFWDCNYLLVCLMAQNLPQLQKLKIKWDMDNGGLCDSVLKQFLEGCSETIQELEIHFTTFARFGVGPRLFSSPQLDIQASPRSHPEFKVLDIEDTREDRNMSDYEHILGDFLHGCNGKSLQKLVIPGTVHFTPKILAILHEIGFTETALAVKVHRFKDISDTELANVINLNPYWKHVDLEEFRNFGPVTEKAVLDQCENFTHLMVNNCQPVISSHGVLTILRRASNLVELRTTSDQAQVCITHDPRLEASDIASCTLPWQCARTLRILALEIAHVPRPDVAVGYRNQSLQAQPDHMVTIEESRVVQRKIYRRLGQLTQLRELCLGGKHLLPYWTYEEYDRDGGRQIFDRKFQPACLEMSLASGLEELAELKELQVLDVSAMAHRIGIMELEWMQSQWPKLKHIFGLYHPGFVGQWGVQAWVEQHQPQWHAMSPPESKSGVKRKF